MSHITFIKKKFSPSSDGTFQLHFTEKALLRAVIAAGQEPGPGQRTVAAEADIGMRINAIRSAVSMRGSALIPTQEYLDSGSTDKGHKSFYVGNALCAHSAYLELAIPWLVDFERLDPSYRIGRTKSKQRPDFLGKDTAAHWFTFESKGRSTSPGATDLKKWKKQVRVVKRVNRAAVTRGIVSAAYMNRCNEWELLWVDPPADEDAAEVNFDDFDFFQAYYQPIVDFINPNSPRIDSPLGGLMLSHPAGAYVGLHPDVLSAFRSREAAQILSFASKLTADESILADGSSLFRDGLIIKLGPEWGNESRGPVSQLAPQVDISPGPQPGNRTLSTSADVGQPERTTQDRVVALFRDELCYRYLGDWTDRDESGHDT